MMQTWGLTATILAPAAEILHFAAYHLEAGAQRLYLYLDAENETAFTALKAHPKIRVTTCDAAWWEKRGKERPKKHQVRQTVNATHAYQRRAEVDWLIHMDVDEFLVSDRGIGSILSAMPATTPVARARPMEALSGEACAFKGFIAPGPARARITSDLYPTFGAHVNGGFLSHLAGKVFVRTGLEDVRVQIHNAFQNDSELKGADLDQVDIALAHCHAKTWDDWHAAYQYRLTKGSYRAALGPNKPRDQGRLSMHELFRQIERDSGTAGLRAFFDEICADTPDLRARLARHGLLRKANLALSQPLSMHFPDFRAG